MTFGTVVPLFAAGSTNGNLCIHDMLAGHYEMSYTCRRKRDIPPHRYDLTVSRVWKAVPLLNVTILSQ